MRRTIAVSLIILGTLNVTAQQKNDTIKKNGTIEEVELFGERNKQPEGLEVITRLPLKPRDQIQSISVLSSKVIEDLGGLSLIDVTKNVPGVTLFSSYGSGGESMSMRGYRGVPVLKNGVQMDSDFRTAGMITDMQGIESIQVLKGSAAVTQGIGNGLGSAGGVINIVTKKPHFVNKSDVGFRYGSWDFYRPTLDFQRVLDQERKVAVRLNATYQKNNSFRPHVDGERIYINPSVAFRPDSKTEIVAEMDFLHDRRTPDRGTINLAPGDTEALYDMPKNEFLGYTSDFAKVDAFNFSTTIERQLSNHLKIRTAYMSGSRETNSEASSIAHADNTPWTERYRTIGKSRAIDENKVFQFDFIGQDVQTGFIKHTFQVGFDWKESQVTSFSFNAYKNSVSKENLINAKNTLDSFDVLQGIPNTLPISVVYQQTSKGITTNPVLGAMAQDVLSFGDYVKMHAGIRYSKLNGSSYVTTDAWNPSLGLMLFPLKNLNIFGSYTTTTSLRSANQVLFDGGHVGASDTRQWEAGIKSDWFNERLRFNVTLFSIKTNRLSYTLLDENYNPIVVNGNTMYGLAGNLARKGAEVELIGRILPNLQVMAGWAYLDAQYKESPAYMNGSTPMNAPKHTANAWLNYRISEGLLTGLDFGAGIYYVGERPVDEWTQKTYTAAHVNSVKPGTKPFNMPEYTTVDAQVGYVLKNGLGIRLLFNNIFDAVGYSSYFRGGYIDQIKPRNFAAQLNYKF